ncbi:MAG: hypothetical protein ACUVQG_11450 [Thermogutta sp.]
MKDSRKPARLIWRYLRWGLFSLLAAGIFLGLIIYRNLDTRLKDLVEGHCAQLFPDLTVRVRSAQLLMGEGVQIRGLRIVDPNVGRDAGVLLEVDEIFLAGPLDYKQLLSRNVQIDRVLVRRPHLRLVCEDKGEWNVARLLASARGSGKGTPFQIENGTIEIVDMRKGPPSVLTLRDIQLLVTPPAPRISTANSPWNLRGTMTGDFLRRIDLEGSIDATTLSVRLSGEADSIEFGPELQRALPLEVTGQLEGLQHLRAQVGLTFQVFASLRERPEITFDVTGQIFQGWIDDPRLPHPISDIRASFSCRNLGIEVRDLSATMGQTTIAVPSFRLHGRALSDPFDLEAHCQHVEFDPAIVRLLPAVLQQEWPKYFPQGLVDLSIRCTSRPEGLRFSVIANLQDVSFAYYKFPYRLQQTHGRMELTPERLTIQLVARANGRPVEIRGQVLTPLTSPRSQIFISGEGIPIDDRLVDAVLNPKTQRTIRSLQISGTADVWLSLWQDKPGEELHRHLEANLNRCSIKYEKFPYPISNIRGRLIMRDDAWCFEDLKGNHGAAKISADGTLLADKAGTELKLRFRGQEIRLDNTLRDAFQLDYVRSAWDDLQPNGLVDVEGVLICPPDEPMKLNFSARPSNRGVTLEPKGFPYRMECLDGTFIYQDGKIFVHDFHAFHGNTELQANVTCSLMPSGGWQLEFSDLWVDRLVVDRSLLLALPEELSRTFARLNIQGPLTIRGGFTIGRWNTPNNGNDRPSTALGQQAEAIPLTVTWDIVVTLVQTQLDTGLSIQNINGRIALRGEYRNNRFSSVGQLDLDALSIAGCYISRLKGPFSLENGVIFLGDYQNRVMSRDQDQAAAVDQYVTGELFAGQITGGGWVRVSPQIEYDLAGSLVAADFGQILREYHRTDVTSARAKVDASVRIRGKGDSIQGLNGYGSFQFRDADIYELPIMIALLKLFGLQRPEPTSTFTESTGSFRIAGRHIYLDTITFCGDLFHLTGQGEMDFDRNVRLVLRVMLGKRETQIPIVREIFRGASEQIVLVHVGGTLQEPIVRRESFPGVNQAIQRFQNSMEALGQRELDGNRR